MKDENRGELLRDAMNNLRPALIDYDTFRAETQKYIKRKKAVRMTVLLAAAVLVLAAIPAGVLSVINHRDNVPIDVPVEKTGIITENQTLAPGGDETQTPGGNQTQAPGGDQTQAPGGDQTQAPGGDETQAPGGDQTQAPGGDETQAPGGKEDPSPTILDSGICGENGTWRLLSGNTLVIKDETGNYEEYSQAPWSEYDEQINEVIFEGEITEIGAYTFQGNENLTDIIIPNSVTSIGEGAFFGCFELESIFIPASVTDIGEGIFRACNKMKNITVAPDNPVYYSESNCIIRKSDKVLVAGCITSVIPDSVTAIGPGAFAGCEELKNITIPYGVTSIGMNAFENCISLDEITIPDSVTSIGDYAFGWCACLTEITIPDSVTSIGKSSFEGCFKLKVIYFKGRTFIPDDWDFGGVEIKFIN